MRPLLLTCTLLALGATTAASQPPNWEPAYTAWTEVRFPAVRPSDAGTAACALPTSTPMREGVRQAAVDSLVALAAAARSDALVLLKDGKLIGEWHFGRDSGPVDIMSITKPLAGMAIGRLVTTGRLTSLDEPLATFYPEWRQGRKRSITVRHVLQHTSGLQNVPNTGVELEPSPDFLQLALSAELEHDPGAVFSYNNKAMHLLGGVVERLSGRSLDAFLHAEIFTPLCFGEVRWLYDPSGRPMVMSGARLRAVDLARIGQLMLDGGEWAGERLVAREWVDSMVVPSQPHQPAAGLLWFLLPEYTDHVIDTAIVAGWRAAGVDTAVIARLQPLVGRRFRGAEFTAALDSVFGAGSGFRTWHDATAGRGVPGRRSTTGPLRAFYHDGWLGQYLVVLPRERIVAVRLIRRRPDPLTSDGVEGFPGLVVRLFGSGEAP